MNTLFLIIIGIGIAFIFSYLRGKIITKVKDTAFEKFDSKKLRAGLFRINDKVSWVKDIVSIFNVRKLCILLLIAGVVYGVGLYRGKLGKPINVDLNYEKSFTLQLNGQTLHKPKNSSELELRDKKGNKIKTITAGDVKELQRKLSPFGFILEPYFSTGIALTDKGIKQDTGIGINWLKFYKWRIGNWLSNNGIWIGVDYKLTENFAIGGGYGKGYKGSGLVGIRGQFKF